MATAPVDPPSDGGKKERSIARWFIGDTLGKGGYSWVKKGIDKTTGKPVALKFMSLADDTWIREQERLVVTEIECLRTVRHKNVLKLYAYNLGAKYPKAEADGTFIDAVMLVLEYAPGGDLFDILYYTSALEPILARTYFRQLMCGLKACHVAGVCHRDLKPQNLLLDAKFQLKITDFGLSKIWDTTAAAAAGGVTMKTTVGTRGYKAPELLLGLTFDEVCDVFSAGVILFILLNGYPPFENASKADKWYRPIAKGNALKFWKQHEGCNCGSDESVKELLFGMLAYDPRTRLSVDEVYAHSWTNAKRLKTRDIVKVLRERHSRMELKRKKDTKKITDLKTSCEKARAVPGMDKCVTQPPLYPESENESVLDIYTTADWRTAMNVIYDVIGESEGSAKFDFKNFLLSCELTLMSKPMAALVPDEDVEPVLQRVCFVVRVFRSRLFQGGAETVYALRVNQMDGDVMSFRHVVASVVFNKCGGVLTGLPDWAKAKAATAFTATEALMEDYDSDAEMEEDEYDAVLAADSASA